MSTSPCCAPSTIASWPSESMKSIDWGLTNVLVPPDSESAIGWKPPRSENFQSWSRGVVERSLPTGRLPPSPPCWAGCSRTT